MALAALVFRGLTLVWGFLAVAGLLVSTLQADLSAYAGIVAPFAVSSGVDVLVLVYWSAEIVPWYDPPHVHVVIVSIHLLY
jgi:hypothetical protein